MKIVNFKSVSPLYEMERDGTKPFTTRRIDPKDKRFRALSQWRPHYPWGIRITNPSTGESFIRAIVAVDYFCYFDRRKEDWNKRLTWLLDWKIIILGARLK